MHSSNDVEQEERKQQWCRVRGVIKQQRQAKGTTIAQAKLKQNTIKQTN